MALLNIMSIYIKQKGIKPYNNASTTGWLMGRWKRTRYLVNCFTDVETTARSVLWYHRSPGWDFVANGIPRFINTTEDKNRHKQKYKWLYACFKYVISTVVECFRCSTCAHVLNLCMAIQKHIFSLKLCIQNSSKALSGWARCTPTAFL